ncbi:twin-arginine translocase subunit TatC [Gleimia hominis]|uniref:twin-arginine translocase subunit TatC n=1 Tax=Gleimia hominis TaxID=595468 RepID=UPI001E4EC8CA|nr:twin-arginine translocase subunit TatC [Gleimia hominis]WIK65076.1 twin-arginine translocase subunit TatC [Gleimia hominis]
MASKQRDPQGRMPLLEHLRELRKRLLIALVGILVGTIVAWFFYEPIFNYMAAPLAQLRAEGQQAELNFETVSAAFDLKLRISMFAGFLATTPWWMYQIWAYLAPALRKSEKIYILSFTFAGIILFVAGGATGVWIMPHAVHILTSFAPSSSVLLMKSSVYFTFYMRLVVVFGLSFTVPLVMVGLNFLGVVRARTLLKAWRWAVVIAFVFAAIANPLPDPWTMTFQALMLCGLYFLAVGIAFLRDRSVDKKRAKEDAELNQALSRTGRKEPSDGEA